MCPYNEQLYEMAKPLGTRTPRSPWVNTTRRRCVLILIPARQADLTLAITLSTLRSRWIRSLSDRLPVRDREMWVTTRLDMK